MLDVVSAVKKSCGEGGAKVGLSVAWMDSSIEFEDNFNHPVFLLNWIGDDFESRPETFFRLWLMSTKTEDEKDLVGRELVFQVVKMLEGLGVEVIAVTTGGGFKEQGTRPVAEVALVRSDLIEEINDAAADGGATDAMDTTNA